MAENGLCLLRNCSYPVWLSGGGHRIISLNLLFDSRLRNFNKMAQHLIIAALFVAALAYLGYITYKSFTSTGCSSGCGSCGIDFSKIRKELRQKGIR